MMNPYLSVLVVLWIYFSLFFIAAQRLRNNSIVDSAWGPGFALASWTAYLTSTSIPLILPICISIWALRLVIHITWRNFGKPEDYRYQAMRKKWGPNQKRNAYFKVFMLQLVLLYIIVFAAISTQMPFANGPYLYGGVLLFLVGLLFESISDEQLRRFVLTKKPGQIMTQGLWAYSRHPNYFGEATLWWGIYFIAIGFNAPLWTIISPLTITGLVRFVSGVPLLEKRYEGNLAYEDYKKKTSIFIPMFPKR